MRVLAIACLLVSLTLAGCAEDAPPQAGPAAEEEAFEDLEPKATETTGVIRGIVLDHAVQTVSNATVKVINTEKETLSNDKGAFVFEGLEPGTYFVEASKTAYTSMQIEVAVEAGNDKPEIQKITIIPDGSKQPLIEAHSFNGHITCSWTIPVAALAMCSVPEIVGVDMGDNFLTAMNTNGVPTFVQGEQIWESSQTLGSALSFSFYAGSTSAPGGGSLRGESPLIHKKGHDFLNRTNNNPMWPKGQRFAFRTFSSGHPDTTAGGTWGVGVTIEQPFDVYTHVFWNTVPDTDWEFINDGPPS